MEKSSIRKSMLTRLKNLSEQERQAWGEWACQAISELVAYQEARTIATFLSMPHEVDTAHLIKRAQRDEKRVLIPKTYAKGRMVFVPYDAHDVMLSSFGVWEPQSDEAVGASEIDVIHVPGLAWNEAGYRIGYGGGFYDRYLEDYQGMTVSTIYDFQRCYFIEETFDQAVRKVLCYERNNQ
ncbi:MULTISPECIES: 5-formyltetrahydrofolate cyclo-ligase [unclassified Streptococcus]|uniref:5-formyltetrahydrofolate cyclo-ligase n=1 Tax=unclassified Streptococcus TaxID=2608887 RepID=UPI001071A972|nr:MULTISPECIES: 5-formyltetrahydrofolate cyclo-ligase [unclassified Streptococcus]MBF0787435.1 5-formyltetrahydrofolate cyclo-ligase [Streptococcus sp. 19428wC2_LYSM12]MCQ9211740.1 5-formyltetrahydrofolate cyclo-ligase [Streptococcus sp. B01]MCQ9213071.1 5-formyltetrahydrofolate cyclo-ligase [Streptococcus sp. O1]TFV05666.1 5-formyltetrahydrofolate cyclo-ligase [Streptococcus sp. LYSM12]